jgi:hypothetical protein
MKKALLVPLVVVALAIGLTAFHANFLSQDRVDWCRPLPPPPRKV